MHETEVAKTRIICRRFELIEPFGSPTDDPWTLRPIASPLPPVRSTPSDASITEADELAYMTFAEGARAENGGQALAALPDGAYWLVRRALPSSPIDGGLLQLGNDLIPLPPFADVVLD